MKLLQLCRAVCLFSFTFFVVCPVATAKRPNVLFIAVDDLRPELGCYGAAHIHSPNIDAFAASALRFDRAYCQQAVCNPSRSSLMTGMMPETIGVTGNHVHFRTKHPTIVTIPQHFRNHGYHAAAIGKIYHGVFPRGSSITKWDTMGDPESWSEPATRFGPRYYYTEPGIDAAKKVYERIYKPVNQSPDDWTKKLVFGPATESPDVSDNTLFDGKVADAAIARLTTLKDKDEPFFLAVGFIKPHSPYIAPKKYFDLYDSVDLPTHPDFPSKAPKYAGHGSGELRRYTDQPKRGALPDENQRRVRHAYYACISFIDEQIGRVLSHLDALQLRDNTIVVLFGDHGYHLGEKGLWGKTTNFELDTRVPLLLRYPGMQSGGQSTSSLAELIDLYPTLSELAHLPIAAQLEGSSLTPVLKDPRQSIKAFARSQYPRRGGLMGYSRRTLTHRLTQWVHQQSGEVRSTELYDYSDSPNETENVAAAEPALVAQIAGLKPTTDKQVERDATDKGSAAVSSFEGLPGGQFTEIKTAVGTWTPHEGQPSIDPRRGYTGDQCLHIAGAKSSSVILTLPEDIDTSGSLSFRAERWTKRDPFSFRIEMHAADGWKELFNGDDQIKVGRSFLSHVRIPLSDQSIRQLKFIVQSPQNSGILIDDVRIAAPQPQRITNVELVPLTLPALVGRDFSPLAKIRVETTGELNPICLSEVQTSLDGTARPSDIAALQVRFGTSGKRLSHSRILGEVTFTGEIPEQLTVRCDRDEAVLQEGTNFVWITAELADDANIDRPVGVDCQSQTFSNGQTIPIDAAPSIQRTGIALRQRGDDGAHTFRIPGLATTNKGTLIGVYDIRHKGGGDLPGHIDVGMSRSTNGGHTWDDMQTIMDMGDDSNWRYDGIGDPAILVDRNTGTIWVSATWSHGNRSWTGSGPGLTPEETGQLMLVRSDDDGMTWSDPINITPQIKRPEWCFLLQGPGKGITMQDGTIVFAAQFQDTPQNKRTPRSTIIYSKDHGDTWNIGTGAFDDTTEAQVVEIEPGVLMLNCRYDLDNTRVVMTTRDMGQTWTEHFTSRGALVEPRSCMASLIDVDQELNQDAGGWLLFSNPNSLSGRHHITIKASSDLGDSWPVTNQLLLDEGNGAGYSCMTMIDEQTVGILYEGSQAHLTFQRIPLSDLTRPPANGALSSAQPRSIKMQSATKSRPNILLIVGEDHGCELSCYGDPVINSPHIDRLAEQGVLFEQGYVTQSVCSPSRSTIFTGLYPHQNGQLGLATHQYSWFQQWPTTYSLLKQAGYRTGLIGKTHINPEQAVEAFVDYRFQRQSNFAKRHVADYAAKAGQFFRAGDAPFFMTVNYPDAHWPLQGQVDGLPESQVDPTKVQVMPYVGGETHRIREIVRNYYDCMLRLDACVGQLLQELDESGKADNTLVVFIGDHGAQMARGKVTVYEGGLKVPFIIRWPGVTTSQRRSKALVSTIDLLPTFMDAAGIQTPKGLPGMSLRPVCSGTTDIDFREHLICERNCDAARHTFPQRTIRDARYKLIHSPVRDREDPAARYYRIHGATHWSGCLTDDELANASTLTQAGYGRWLNPPEFQLYDLHNDPWEWTDLATDPNHAATKDRLIAALNQWQDETLDPLADPIRLRQLLAENDAVFRNGRRSPENGWQYLQYLAP